MAHVSIGSIIDRFEYFFQAGVRRLFTPWNSMNLGDCSARTYRQQHEDLEDELAPILPLGRTRSAALVKRT